MKRKWRKNYFKRDSYCECNEAILLFGLRLRLLHPKGIRNNHLFTSIYQQKAASAYLPWV
jgi:hypothetical protein